MKKIRIVSDGTPYGGRVYDENGVAMDSVASVTIHKITGGDVVRATVEFVMPQIDIVAEVSESSDG